MGGSVDGSEMRILMLWLEIRGMNYYGVLSCLSIFNAKLGICLT